MKSNKVRIGLVKRSAALFIALAASIANISAQSQLSNNERKLTKAIEVKTIERITRELSDDKLEGRGTLQRGGDMAASWIAEQMKAIGLKPLGDNGTYLQSVPLVSTEFTADALITLNGESLVYGKDWSAGTLLADMAVETKMVFVGFGMVSDELGRNDLKDVDLKGKIAVVIQGPPRGYTAEKWTEITDKVSPFPLLFQRGAIGLILVTNDRALYKADYVVNQTGRRNIATVAKSKERAGVPLLFLVKKPGRRCFKARVWISIRQWILPPTPHFSR